MTTVLERDAARTFPRMTLTATQREALDLAAAGLDNRTIAAHLKITTWAVLRRFYEAALANAQAHENRIPMVVRFAVETRSGEALAKPSRALARRQRQVARLLTRGLTDIEIGRAIGINPNTVKRHMQKLGTIYGIRGRRGIAVRFALDATRGVDLQALA